MPTHVDIRFDFEGAGSGFTSVVAPTRRMWFGLNFGAHEQDSVRFQVAPAGGRGLGDTRLRPQAV